MASIYIYVFHFPENLRLPLSIFMKLLFSSLGINEMCLNQETFFEGVLIIFLYYIILYHHHHHHLHHHHHYYYYYYYYLEKREGRGGKKERERERDFCSIVNLLLTSRIPQG